MEPRILHEEAEFVVIDKPAGLISHSDGRTVEASVAAWILSRWPELREIGEPWVSPQGEVVVRPGMVQRLDRATSGIMVVAKTQEMYAHLKTQFKERNIEKTYRAIVYGVPERKAGRIVAEIERVGELGNKRWEARSTLESDPRAAITDWRFISERNIDGVTCSELEIMPRTGRTHQIRVHLASIGHPVVGDPLYAVNVPLLKSCPHLLLHASSLRFIDLEGRRRKFESPLPKRFHVDLRTHLS